MAERGSDYILKRCRTPISDDVLGKLDGLITEHGGRLVGWECLGQPAADAVLGVAHAGSIDETVNMLKGLLELEPGFTFEVFPRGIPFPEFFELRFGTPGFGH